MHWGAFAAALGACSGEGVSTARPHSGVGVPVGCPLTLPSLLPGTLSTPTLQRPCRMEGCSAGSVRLRQPGSHTAIPSSGARSRAVPNPTAQQSAHRPTTAAALTSFLLLCVNTSRPDGCEPRCVGAAGWGQLGLCPWSHCWGCCRVGGFLLRLADLNLVHLHS